MWKYEKKLQYPVDIKKKDLRMARYLVTQYGGSNGELAAAWRYYSKPNYFYLMNYYLKLMVHIFFHIDYINYLKVKLNYF